MTESRDTTGVLRDLSLLYELSLSVGRSLDLNENCREFLGTLMARKSLDYSAVWIRSSVIDPDASQSLRLVFATPAFRAAADELPDAQAFESLLANAPFASVAHGSDGFEQLVAESGIDSGVYAVYRLGEHGFLKLYSIGREEPFPDLELSKLRHVVEQFSNSVAGCLDHARVRREEDRRRELEQQVLHAQKLESLGLLAGGIAHDFNNLLSVILGNADLIRLDADVVPSEPLDQLVTAAMRASDLCSQLLAYSGRGRLERRTFDLTAAVEEMLKLSSVTVSKKARIHAHLVRDLPRLEGDRGQIGQVAMNLITNGSEALGDQDGDLWVTTGFVECTRRELSEFRLGEDVEPGPCVFLDVEDTGCGIDPGVLDRLFDPFYTTKFTGRGLGLAAVLGIVRSHGGAIRIGPRPSGGTSVRALFPAAADHPGEPEPELSHPESEYAGGTILVVDDEKPVRQVIQGLLETIGCDVHTANDGGDGVRKFVEMQEKLDLILLDYTMPVLNGREVFERIRELNADVPIVVMSGFSDIDLTVEFAGRRPTAFLSKPFRITDLRQAVRACLGSRAGLS